MQPEPILATLREISAKLSTLIEIQTRLKVEAVPQPPRAEPAKSHGKKSEK